MKRIALFLLALLLLAGCRGTVSLAHADQTATEAMPHIAGMLKLT